jgi:TP901 family phage tail tape measure protein
MAKNIAIDVQIKNVKKISDLKQSLKELRKEQRDTEKATKDGVKLTGDAAKKYKENAKAIDKQSKSLRTLNRDQKDATKSSGSLSKSFIKSAAAIGIVVGAFRAVSRMVSSVVTTFTEFEFVMAKVNAVSGATEREFSALTETAEELGRTTFFTATQVGELMLNFSKLGFTANEIQNAVEPTLALATATGSDLARAATVAGAAVRGFALDASETERVVDVMAVSFSSSAMNIEKWQTSMTKVAPIAKSAGFSIEDTAAIMSKLTDSGIEASIAGTSLRNILLKMQDPSSDLTKSFGSTIHSLDQLVPAMKKFVEEGGSMADVMEVVDLRQAAAFEQMITSADSTIELRDAMLASNGEGKRMADIVGDTLQGAFLRLKSALQGVSIELMTNYSDGLKDAIERGAKWLNNLAANSDKLITLINWIKGTVVVLLSYKLGVIAANTYTVLYTQYQTAAATATGLYSRAVAVATTTTQTFSKALARTGIGALVLVVADLAVAMATFNSEAQKAKDFVDLANKGYAEQEKTVANLGKSVELLEKAKKELDKWSKEEIENMDKTSLEYAQYSKSLLQAHNATSELNGAFKDNGIELINLQTDIEDTKVKFAELSQQMMQTAMVSLSADLTKELVQTKMSVDQLFKDLQGGADGLSEELIHVIAEMQGEFGGFQDWLTTSWIARNITSPLTSWVTGNDDLAAQFGAVKDKADELGVSMGDIVEFSNIYGDSNAVLDEKMKELSKTFVDLGIDVSGLTGLVGDDLPDSTGRGTDAITKNTDKLKENTVMQDLATDAKFDYVEMMKHVLDGTISLEDAEKRLRNITIDRAQAELDAIPIAVMNANLRMELEEKIIKLKLKNHKEEEKLRKDNAKSIKKELKNYKDLGSALVAVAGDNEKLNGIRKAGEAITRAAAVAESILNLQKAISTITEGKLTIATLLGTKAKIAESTAVASQTPIIYANAAADTMSIGPKVAAGAASQAKLPFPLNIIAVVATIALLAKIMKMFEKGGIIDDGGKFARGGMVHGPSHAQGGVKFAVGGRVNELEGGEAVINKRSTAMFRNQLSEMNQAGGGVKFADGGIMSSPSFTQAQFDAVNQSNILGAVSEQRKVVVVEADITDSQSTVSVIQANATF